MQIPHLDALVSILETDPNWERGGGTVNVTRRFIISAALLSVAAVCMLLIVLPVGYALFAPAPFEYRNLPFKVCGPGSTAQACRPLQPKDSFHGGDVVPFVVDRCVTDPFAKSTFLPYVVSRNVVNEETGTRLILPSLSTEAPSAGCESAITVAHQLPEVIVPGRYYLEGVATVYGRFRTANAYFRTESFNVTR